MEPLLKAFSKGKEGAMTDKAQFLVGTLLASLGVTNFSIMDGKERVFCSDLPFSFLCYTREPCQGQPNKTTFAKKEGGKSLACQLHFSFLATQCKLDVTGFCKYSFFL